MNDVDATQREAAATVERVSAALKDAQAMLDKSSEMAGDAATPGFTAAFAAKQGAEALAAYEKAVAEVKEEIERDLPKQEAKRTVRVKPTRQMV